MTLYCGGLSCKFPAILKPSAYPMVQQKFSDFVSVAQGRLTWLLANNGIGTTRSLVRWAQKIFSWKAGTSVEIATNEGAVCIRQGTTMLRSRVSLENEF